MLYPAFIEIDDDGSASGWFPDVAGCYFAGDTIEEAYADARSAIDAHFELTCEKGLPVPIATSMQEHIAKDCDAYQNGQWLLVDVNMDKFDGRAERINVTLPHRLLTRIDSIVKQSGEYSSRSAFLATAARNELQKTG
ncbi:type II toxin-antitoxin system HicB family antitoxin [Yersinia enterocolitica]|uniref:HicB-like antitoxin of toxin-antitoxin system domain-containing protein n=1 Tax=Yersinia enterocolitica TaxID=630 RepID=A0A9P1PT48_YEREN|nr:type II toxin-antitoxin system HicB family antitoxin [Yersinia enterocolitica]EKN5999804.1 type II toxin-antitoxin system HicB family antitoxin [Yersinia enterocolitica]MBW5823298.1 type II toxin-antitoxin system HicB family antitoxin [Yersinia enterocolitica]MBW5853144.1 type II toxin-antitoxin system HicB family antitoxin [Yersinia enterocolitica]MBW5870529.1 type II toxin-antitoxin system HicB family antitoxin [Yersinia enterocolitica]MBW5879359.1 type II toxin-antitoxin system HicB fami